MAIWTRKHNSAVECLPYKEKVVGSNPAASTKFMNKMTLVKSEDLQIGDVMPHGDARFEGPSYPAVVDLFYRTNTLARTNKSGKGMVVVMWDNDTVTAYPIGKELMVLREEAPQVSG